MRMDAQGGTGMGGGLHTVAEVAEQLRIAVVTVRKRLCLNPERFSVPRYRRDGSHPRRLRVLTDADVAVLMEMITGVGFNARRRGASGAKTAMLKKGKSM